MKESCFLRLSSGPLPKVKNKGKFQTLALKVVAVAYERWSFTRGSECSDLTWNETFGVLKNWSQWRGGRLRDVVATGSSTLFTEILLSQNKTGTCQLKTN